MLQPSLEGTSTQPAHDQIRRVRIAPVVDEGHDVRMLDVRDEVSLRLESADELGLAGELGADLLDRHFALDRWLDPAPDDRERPGAHLLEEAIAAERPSSVLDEQGRVSGDERILQPQHLGGGIQAVLVDEDLR